MAVTFLVKDTKKFLLKRYHFSSPAVAKKTMQYTELLKQKKNGVKCTDICKCEGDECQSPATHNQSCPDEFEEDTDIEDD